MIKRIRDKVRNFKPQATISSDEWDNIKARYAVAKKFLDEENPISSILRAKLKESEELILQNQIKEVREIRTLSKGFKKIFITPKKVIKDEIVGQVKFIRFLLLEIESWISLRDEIEKQEANGQILILKDESSK